MKKNILKVTGILYVMLMTMCLQAQTYTVDAAGSQSCNEAAGIEQSFVCTYDYLANPTALGSFTDTNVPGIDLSSMSIILYAMCNGDFEVFINDVSAGTGTTTGTGCFCDSIDTNPNMVKNITVTLTPEILAAYNIGGVNYVSVSSSNSSSGDTQCFYGAKVTVTSSTLNVDDKSYASVKLTPNPATNMFEIKGLKQVEPYKIYNVLGAEVLRGTMPIKGKVEVGHLSHGVYYLKLEKKGNVIKFLKR